MRTNKTMDAFPDRLMHLQPAMQLMAERLLRSAADAEDAVQEAVIELWERRSQLQHVHNLEGYAMQSVKFRCISLLRKQQDLLSEEIEAFDNLTDEDYVAEAQLMEERAKQLDGMMARLPEKQRLAVQMRYIEQLSHEEMQQQLGMTSTHVYTTLSRAMSALKTLMKQ